MKKVEEKRTIKVNVVKFDNGKQIDSSVIEKFINEASDFEDTINASEHYTDEYFYFETDEEKKLESILLELGVIKKAPEQKRHNDLVGKENTSEKNYRYRLGSNYEKFESDFYDLVYNYDNKTEFEDFKDREFLGDKLLDVIMSDILLENGVDRNSTNRELSKYTNNKFLETLFDKLELELNPKDISTSDKKKGNTVEEYLWKYFIKNGYLELKILLKKNIEL